MPELLVQAENLHKTYGGKTLFENADFDIYAGDRIGLVGPNGCGKTTLFNLIMGTISLESAQLKLKDDIRVRFLNQAGVGHGFDTVGAFLKRDLPQVGLEARIAEMEKALEDPALYETEGFQKVINEVQDLKNSAGWETPESRMRSALSLLPEMKLTGIDGNTPVEGLSGGERQKIALADVLSNARNCDLLLLDEPTNHLDIQTIEWLGRRINNVPCAVLMVSHDRYLLDDLVTRIFDIDGRTVTPYQGNYSTFESTKTLRSDHKNREKKRRDVDIRRQKASIQKIRSRDKYDSQIKSKVIRMEQQLADDEKKGLGSGASDIAAFLLKFKFKSAFKSGKNVAESEGVTKTYGDVDVLDNIAFEIINGERIGLIGPNGCGKTTLLKLLTGAIKADGGEVFTSRGVRSGYFDQGHLSLDPKKTLLEEVRGLGKGLEEDDAKALLGRFNFRDVIVNTTIDRLSGGERARIALLKLIFQPYNLLLLDEPTNHMDIDSKSAIAEALNIFDGTIVVVSHDRYFLDQVAKKIYHLEDGKLTVYTGNYSSFAKYKGMKVQPSTRSKRWIVQKKFTEWSTRTKHKVGDEVFIDDSNEKLYEWAVEKGLIKLVEG